MMLVFEWGFGLCSYKRHYPTITRQFGEFLYIRKEHVENNLFLEYYVRMANFNKVIKVLNIKSAVNLLWTSARGAIETTHSIAKYYCVVSIALLIGIHCNFILKTFITLLKLAIRT